MNKLYNKPEWLKIKIEHDPKFDDVRKTLSENSLVTVCEEAHCPNINECWSSGTATFMVLGDTCTRGCRFCNVKSGRYGANIDPMEPMKIAESVKKWGLDYIVITSVDRDDLPDQGSEHFAKVITTVHQQSPEVLIEVLVPDFRGDVKCVETVVQARPNVFAHNVETIERLQGRVRDNRATYEQSLMVLEYAKKQGLYTKSSLMVGLGETEEEIAQTMDDLRRIDVDFLTLGQYLRPSLKHLEVVEYVHPDQFEHYKKIGLEKGFRYIAAGPFVRSSYKAGEFFIKSIVKENGNDGA
ncbi:lipoyl synthase [Candidatus Uabimicrobium amorphum]|uniref:Lipoyl synthase n=1 Tax=Uabimicrobium amorphum TaxID=2596890 RepID=A0A5S9IQR1_UABAM|nr:lipoyl synthase [Candidatus Uabimicrobium amorphum]BBM85906.1 lipoyl synthase [Candidatus Uabimicrobium amorphum]